MKKIREYGFGYDIDNIMEVEEYVWKNYSEEEFKMNVGRGDSVMNYLTIYREDDDEGLNELIECCDGEGDFEE